MPLLRQAGCGNTQRSEAFHEARRVRVARQCRRHQERAKGSRRETALFRQRHPPRKGMVVSAALTASSGPVSHLTLGKKCVGTCLTCPTSIYTHGAVCTGEEIATGLFLFFLVFAPLSSCDPCLQVSTRDECSSPFPLFRFACHSQTEYMSLPKEVRTQSCKQGFESGRPPDAKY